MRATKGIYKNKMGVPERQAVDEAVDREIGSYVKLLEKNQDLRIRVERALSQGMCQSWWLVKKREMHVDVGKLLSEQGEYHLPWQYFTYAVHTYAYPRLNRCR